MRPLATWVRPRWWQRPFLWARAVPLEAHDGTTFWIKDCWGRTWLVRIE